MTGTELLTYDDIRFLRAMRIQAPADGFHVPEVERVETPRSLNLWRIASYVFTFVMLCITAAGVTWAAISIGRWITGN